VDHVAHEASRTAKAIVIMFDRDQRKIQGLGKAAASALGVHDLLTQSGVISLPKARQALKLSFPTVNKAMFNLQRLGIV